MIYFAMMFLASFVIDLCENRDVYSKTGKQKLEALHKYDAIYPKRATYGRRQVFP